MKFLFLFILTFYSFSTWSNNLIRNSGFEISDSVQETVAWTPQILMPGAKAMLKTTYDTQIQSTVLATWFLAPERAEGARFFQFVTLKPKRVYKLSYKYRSNWDARLSGDVMMTETGNGIYNVMMCPPNTEWTRIVRYIPVMNDTIKQGGIYVQNRSMIPLWYDDISLEETDIPLQEILNNQFKITLHPLTEKDIMLMPTDKGNITFITQIFIPSFMKTNNMVVETRISQEKTIQRSGDFPVKLNKDKTMRIKIPSELLKKGKGQLHAILKSVDGTVYQHTSIEIERFSSIESGFSINLEVSPCLQHNGMNFFPIAFYGVPFSYDEKNNSFNWGEGYYKDIKPYAYNTLQDYIFGGASRPNLTPKTMLQTAFLDAAAKEGKMVMVELPRTLVEYDRQKELEEWIQMIDRHPATLYFRSEEMMHFRKTPLKYLTNAYNTVKKINPQRKYLIFDNLKDEMVPFIDGLDTTGINNKFLALKWRKTVGKNRVLLATVNVEWPGRNSPDQNEQRYHTFMPVIHGARGIAFFMWSIARFQATDKEYIHRIGHSVNELAQITPALTHPYPLPKWYPEIKSKGAVSILRASDGRNHWLLAGPSYPTSSGSISFDLPTGITLQRCFDSSITYKENQRYTFPIKPQRVLIFQLIEK